MLFAVHCLDAAGAMPKRRARHAEHKAYLASAEVRLVVAGPLLNRDGEMAGSLFVVEASSRETVEAFNQKDPFAVHGIWERIVVMAFEMRTDNRLPTPE